MPFNTPYGTPISLEKAQTAVQAAVAEANKRGWPLNVAVVDSGGNLVTFARMDGAQLASIAISEHKARVAAKYRRPILPSSLTACTLRQRPTPRACIAWGSFFIAVEEREPSVPRKITEGSPKGGCSQNRTVLKFPDLVQEFKTVPIPHT